MVTFLASATLPACATPPQGAGANHLPQGTPADATPPNILFIMADDLGYSDIHAMGGEIDTPNLDALVADGRILTNQHAGALSAVTRSMFISGADHHLVGEGTMDEPGDERRGLPGYEGHLNQSALSVVQLLKDAGYHTYMAGKWHLGTGLPDKGPMPDQVGFEHSFALLRGTAFNHFGHTEAGSTEYAEDGHYVQPGQPGQPGGPGGQPALFYSTDFYTQKLIDFIDANRSDGKPFFAYAAYTAPHWPLQVPEPWLSQYKGRYDQGYDVIRAARFARMQAMGIVPKGFALARTEPDLPHPLPPTPDFGQTGARYINALHGPAEGYTAAHGEKANKSWNSLSAEEKKVEARRMEIYAGMVSNLDANIGRLIQHLKAIGVYDHTFIMFESDNGPAERIPPMIKSYGDEEIAQAGLLDAMGRDDGRAVTDPFIEYGRRWAEVSATPFAQMKSFQGEGGISVPAIVHLPGQTQRLPNLTRFTHVLDVAPTLLAVAGVQPPTTPAPPRIEPVTHKDANAGKVLYHGSPRYPMTGTSLLPALAQAEPTAAIDERGIAGETDGRADGHWKARWTEPPFGPADGHWELFDIRDDRGETHDVSATHRRLVEQLVAQWKVYMQRVGGVEPLAPPYGPRQALQP
jgi:arylsulfatase A-like enzyme